MHIHPSPFEKFSYSTSLAPFFSIGVRRSLFANVWAGKAEGAATVSRERVALLAGEEVMQKQ